jgi:TPR repeat protein
MKVRLVLVTLLLSCIITIAQEPPANELRRRALLGDAAAQTSLGFLYQTGSGGVQKDEVSAVYWHRKAAEQGFAPGQYNLGIMYRNGLGGLTKDEGEAVQWYRLAADQGFAPAQNDLAWILCTSVNPKLHDPYKALEYAQKAVAAVTGLSNHTMLYMYQDTLAEVYYVLGQFKNAIRTEEEILTALSPEDKDRSEYARHLTKYRQALEAAGKPAAH